MIILSLITGYILCGGIIGAITFVLSDDVFDTMDPELDAAMGGLLWPLTIVSAFGVLIGFLFVKCFVKPLIKLIRQLGDRI